MVGSPFEISSLPLAGSSWIEAERPRCAAERTRPLGDVSTIEMSPPLHVRAATRNSLLALLRTVENIEHMKSTAIEERTAKRPRSLFHEEVPEPTRHHASHEAAGTYARLMNRDPALLAEIGAASFDFLLNKSTQSTALIAAIESRLTEFSRD